MIRYRIRRMRPVMFLLAALSALAILAKPAPAHDIPSEIILHGYAKPIDNRLHFLVRIPLIMLQNIALPTRGPGYVDLTKVDAKLKQTTAAISREIEFFEDGRRLIFDRARTRISEESDRSFEAYDEALANIEGPKLPVSTNVFWNQGFVDAHLTYPIRSPRADFLLNMRLSGFGKILKLRLKFIPPAGKAKIYEISGGFGRLALDPRWYQVVGLFVKFGFINMLNSLDQLLFLCCLLIPLRRIHDLLPVIIAFTIGHSITLAGSAFGLLIRGAWFPLVLEMLIAVSIFYFALENMVKQDLRYRWIIAGVFGLAYGFRFWFGLHHSLQFTGSHRLLSILSFNAGIEIGQIMVLLVVFLLLAVLFKLPLVSRFGVIILSALLAHTAWHWMLERGAVLKQFIWPNLPVTRPATIAATLAFLILIGLVVRYVAAKRIGGFVSRQPKAEVDLAAGRAGKTPLK